MVKIVTAGCDKFRCLKDVIEYLEKNHPGEINLFFNHDEINYLKAAPGNRVFSFTLTKERTNPKLVELTQELLSKFDDLELFINEYPDEVTSYAVLTTNPYREWVITNLNMTSV